MLSFPSYSKMLGISSDEKENANIKHDEKISFDSNLKGSCIYVDRNTNNMYIVSGGYNKIKIFDPTNYSCIKTLICDNCHITSISTFTDPKTDKVYIVSAGWDKTINVWDVSNWTCVKTLTGHRGGISSVSTFTDTNTDKVYIVSGSYDETIKVWDTSNWTCIKTLSSSVWCISTFNTSIEYNIKYNKLSNFLIDYFHKDVISHYILPYYGKPQTYIASGGKPQTYIVSGGSDNTINIWNTTDWSCKSIRCGSTYFYITSISTYIDKFTGKVFIVIADDDNTIKVCDPESNTFKVFKGHTDEIWSLSTFIDEKTNNVYIISGSRDKTIKIWDVSNGTCVKTLTGHTKDVLSVSTYIDPTGVVSIITSGSDDTIKIWDF